MTNSIENMNDQNPTPATDSLHLESPGQTKFNEFPVEEHDEGLTDDEVDGGEGELTPNDIFGLDPLDVLTLEELADYLKISPAALRRAMKEQNLPGRNIGGEWRFLRDAVANWLRGQEAPAQQQQKAREEYAKPKAALPSRVENENYSRPPQRPYQSEQSGRGEYRPQQRFADEGSQFGNQPGGQYGNRARQYGAQDQSGGQYGSNQSSGGNYGGGQYGSGSGGGYNRPPRRPFRAEGGGGYGGATGNYAAGAGGAGEGTRFGGGGYEASGARYGGAPKRKNKRQVFDNERGKRLDRRKEGDVAPTDE